MKKVFRNKNIIAVALIAVFATAFETPIHATDSTTVNPVELTYLGKAHDQLYFLLNVDNSDKKDYNLLIIDNAGNTLYRETIKGEKISKKFLINADLVEDNQLKFQITDRKTNEMVVYEINQNMRVIQDVVINKLN